jgi:hypothetical protein
MLEFLEPRVTGLSLIGVAAVALLAFRLRLGVWRRLPKGTTVSNSLLSLWIMTVMLLPRSMPTTWASKEADCRESL